jgi:hypothetical protein
MANPFSDVMDLFEDESVPVLSEVPFDAAVCLKGFER